MKFWSNAGVQLLSKLSGVYVHSKRRRLKSGKRKGCYTFDHRSVDHKEILRISREMIIPYMRKVKSKDLRVDCLKSFHHPLVLELYRKHDIRVYPSAGIPQSVPDGYPPNSHDLMPNENIHSEISHNLGCLLSTTPLQKRSASKVFSLLPKAVKMVKLATIRAQIDKLPSVCEQIILKDGGTTKY